MGYFSAVTLSLRGKIRLNIKYKLVENYFIEEFHLSAQSFLYLDMAEAYIGHFAVNIHKNKNDQEAQKLLSNLNFAMLKTKITLLDHF